MGFRASLKHTSRPHYMYFLEKPHLCCLLDTWPVACFIIPACSPLKEEPGLQLWPLTFKLFCFRESKVHPCSHMHTSMWAGGKSRFRARATQKLMLALWPHEQCQAEDMSDVLTVRAGTSSLRLPTFTWLAVEKISAVCSGASALLDSPEAAG